jgi:ankyrin repeat protein
VKNGARTDLLDANGDSAMHWAAYKGEISIVQLLHHLGLPVSVGGRSYWPQGVVYSAESCEHHQ